VRDTVTNEIDAVYKMGEAPSHRTV